MADGVAAAMRPAGLSVCIVACKDLSLNTRVMRQATALARAGHAVTVIGFDVPDSRLATAEEAATLLATGAPLYPGLVMAGLWLTRHVLPGDAGLRRGAAAAVAARRSRGGLFARRAARLLADRSFDVVQAHFDKALIAASIVRRRCGGRLVFDAVEVPFDDELIPVRPVVRALRLAEIGHEIEIARRADSWVTVNDALADAIVDRFGVSRPLVLRNCHHEGRWQSDGRLRSDLGLTENARVLLHLNTLRRGEGIETAIEALAQLPADIHLVALGPMPERGYLDGIRRQAVERGVADRFHVAPMQPAHRLPAYIAGADIGVIARQGISRNLRLSLPNRLFQMIAARLPVIATPLPEIARVVRDWGVGLLFDEFDPHALAAAIRTMTAPSALAGFRTAVDHAAGSLTWERESGAYVRLIEELAADARNRTRPSRHLPSEVSPSPELATP